MKAYDQQQIKPIVLKHLNGTASAREQAWLRRWIADENNKERLDEVIGELLREEDLPYDGIIENEEARIWNQIYTKLKPTVHRNKQSLFPSEIKNNVNRVFLLKRIAAMLVPLVAIGAVLWFFMKSEIRTLPTQNALISDYEKKTNAGEKVLISLPDGSKVKLNSLSSLRYTGDFNVTERKVFLSGEAFFEVVANEQKLFTVVSGKIETAVTGTSFNVKSFSDSIAAVAVTSGNVLVKERRGNNTIALEKDEMTSIHLNDQVWHKSDFDYDKVIGWKDGILVFENAGFEKILARLAGWYGVEFEVLGKANPDILINTTYHNDPLERILHGLSFTYDFNFEIQEKRITIKF